MMAPEDTATANARGCTGTPLTTLNETVTRGRDLKRVSLTLRALNYLIFVVYDRALFLVID